MAAREEERRRLRWDLHDGVGPAIAGLALQAETARDLVADDPVAATAILDRLVPRLNGAVADVRAIVHELRPPTLDELGLAGAVRELATRFAVRGRRVDADVSELGELPAAVDLAAYWIISGGARPTRRVTPMRAPSGSPCDETADGCVSRSPTTARVSMRMPLPASASPSMRARAEEVNGHCTIGPAADGSGVVVAARLPLTLEEVA